VRLRNDVAAIVSRPLGEQDIGPLYQPGTVETLLRYLPEEYGTAVVDSNTVAAGWSLRHLTASSAPPRGVALPAAPRRPPSPPPPQLWGGRRFFFSRPLWGGRRFFLPGPLWGGRRFFFPSPLWGGRRFFLSSPI